MANVLMLASFGLEVVECGGSLAAAAQAGDDVMVAVLLSRPESQPQIEAAARALGLGHVEFLGFNYGEVDVSPASRARIVELLRRTRPGIAIMQDPEHAQHDFDPDRRMIAMLYAESLALASRDWRIEECGGHQPHPVPVIYYMTPLRPNCVVEIADTFALKQRALEALTAQAAFSGEAIRQQASDEILSEIVADWATLKDDNARLGLELHRDFSRADALVHGMAGHSGAILGEPYRREGPFVLDRLTDR